MVYSIIKQKTVIIDSKEGCCIELVTEIEAKLKRKPSGILHADCVSGGYPANCGLDG